MIADADLELTAGCEAVHPHSLGGQHVARHCSGVRAFHRPTGIGVIVTSERSQMANRDKALFLLEWLLENL